MIPSLPPGIIENLDFLGELGFEGVPDLPSGSIPSLVPDSLEGSVNMGMGVLTQLDSTLAEFSEAAKMEGRDRAFAMAGAGLGALGTASAMIPGVGPFAKAGAAAARWFMDKIKDSLDKKAARSIYERCDRIAIMLRNSISPDEKYVEARAYVYPVPRYADCRAQPVSRTVVTVQRHFAPWNILAGNRREFPTPKGRCGDPSFPVYCGTPPGTGDICQPFRGVKCGGSVKRCTGAAELTALLYPWWCGNGPPRIAPSIDDSDRNLHRDVNAQLLEYQTRMFFNPYINATVNLQSVLNMMDSLKAFSSDPRIINGADEEYFIGPDEIGAAIEQCNAFINARVSWMKSVEFNEVITNMIDYPVLDPLLADALRSSPGKYKPSRARPWPGKTRPGARVDPKRQPLLGASAGDDKKIPGRPMKEKNTAAKGGGGKKSSALPLLLVGGAVAAGAVMLSKKKR